MTAERAFQLNSPPGEKIEPMRRAGDPMLRLASVDVLATADGGLAWPDEHLVVVADLHLEKGSSLAERRVFLPPYDTAATLARLARLIRRFAPRRVIFLGDTFHDRMAHRRVAPADRETLTALLAQRDVVWIAGNHDPDPPDQWLGQAMPCLSIGPLMLRHEPAPGAQRGEIAGHLHPVARVWTQGRSLRRRCFAHDGTRLVLPAFGAYAGGLNVRDAAFAPLFPNGLTAHVMGEERVFAFPWRRCLRD